MDNNEKITTDLEKAIEFAVKAHAGAVRKGTDTPYIVHPIEVMKIVCALTDDVDVRIAAVLHDTVEDTSTTIDDIADKFGGRVKGLVADESENKRPDKPERDTWRTRKEETLEHVEKASEEA